MALFTNEQYALLNALDSTGVQRAGPFPGLTAPKPKDWELPFLHNQRKPRVYAAPQKPEIRPDPWPLDFCMWLQSNEFGNNRRHILQLTGARWIGEDEVPTNGTLVRGVVRWLTGLRAQ
jgi:hypothetical protein